MSISKLKAMTETLSRMEQMKKEVTDDVNKDLDKKRMAALKKIREYLDDVAKALDGREVTIYLKESKPFGNDSWQSVRFNQKYIVSRGWDTTYSDKPISWYFIWDNGRKKSNSEYCDYIDGENDIKWAAGFVSLIENWNKIKAEIEEGLEQELVRQMENVRKMTEDKVNSYKIVDEFEA